MSFLKLIDEVVSEARKSLPDPNTCDKNFVSVYVNDKFTTKKNRETFLFKKTLPTISENTYYY